MEENVVFGGNAKPLSVRTWADIVDESDIDVDLEVFSDEEDVASFEQPTFSCCRIPCVGFDEITADNVESILVSVFSILSSISVDKSSGCIINEISNCVALLCHCIVNSLGERSLHLACADAYLRNRHEILHKLSMLSLGLPAEKTDMCFSEQFPISSNRTPDLIFKNEFTRTVLIIESTVSTDKGKSYQMKGKEDEGFKSKYEHEISQIRLLGYEVNYFVLHFDSKDIYNSEYKQELNNINLCHENNLRNDFVEKLELIRRCCCNVQHMYSKFLSPLLSLLFVDTFEPNYYPEKIFDLLKCKDRAEIASYQRVSVSNNTYSRIQTSWPRLNRLLDLSEPDFYLLTLDLITNKLNFKKDPKGMHYDEWSTVLNSQDKATLFLNLKLVVGTTQTTETSGKIEYFFQRPDLLISRDNTIFQLNMHDNTMVCIINTPVPDYSKFLKSNEFIESGIKTERANIDDKISELLEPIFNLETEVDYFSFINKLGKKPFCSNLSGEAEFRKAITDFETQYSKINSLSDEPRNVLHQKSSFLYPLINPNAGAYTSYKEKNTEFLRSLSNCRLGPYTGIILSKISDPNFKFGGTAQPSPPSILKLEDSLSSNQRLINRVQINNKVDNKIIQAKFILECKALLEEQKDIRSKLKQEFKRLNYKKNLISVLRLPTKNRSKTNSLGHKFAQEMKHFKVKDEKSLYKGVGRYNFNILYQEFEGLKNAMMSPSKHCSPDPLYDNYVAEDATLLKKLKEDSLSNHAGFYEYLMNTSIYGTSTMICRLCYTLTYFSQTSIGGDYIYCDNLGFSKTLLLAKGGKKIFKTKRSKLFKLFFPTYQSALNHYCRPGYNSSYTIHRINGEEFIETPWMMLDEQLLSDGLTFLSRTMGFVLINKNLTQSCEETLSLCYFNILLAIHGRRQTEEFLHNIRYLTVNCISECSSIGKMLPTLATFNYDFLQCFLKESLLANFYELACELKKMHDNLGGAQPDSYLEENKLLHLFDRSSLIGSTDQLTLMIYCTFLMSKAPVTQSLEQLRNLKNMLNTQISYTRDCHVSFEDKYKEDTVDLTQMEDFESYWNALFNNDFVYDPGYMNQLGKFCADYLSNFVTKSEVGNRWESYLSQPWDLFANTKGLRGKRGEKDFFGKKGYYIVYKEVMRDARFLEEFEKLLDGDADDFTKRKLLNKYNQEYKKKLNSFELEYCIFHVVDKRQRGGSREIFCMDLLTKIHQQPIEKLCAYFCKNIPNELISIPSSKRVFHIHSNVHERFRGIEGKIYNLVFDCRRWAPHSVFTKFIDFLLGMRDFLPRSFLVHTLAFFEKMNNKRVYTKNYVKNMLDNSLSTSEETKLILEYDELVDAPFMTMPYSWMMGIFNYLSSLVHVANQLHISHIVNNMTVRCLNEEVNLHMTAHSDDSGGKLLCKSRLTMFKVMTSYELLLKSSNHMLSDKKCNISLIYFELLSILYFGERLMSLMPKFAGSFNFHPSDGGYSTDIGEAYSKCIELMMIGATFEQAYMAFKIQTMLIWRFYFGKTVDKIFYCYPPQLLGMPDAHPLNILISGTDADAIRLFLFSDKIKFEEFLKISKFFIGFDKLEDSFLTGLRASPRIITSPDLKNLSSIVNKKEDEDLRWMLNNISLKNTGFQLLSYLEKLKDHKFVAALQDETLERRISRAFYYRNSQCIITKGGLISYSWFRELLTVHYIQQNELEPPIEQDWRDELKNIMSSLGEDEVSFKQGMKYFEILHSEVLTLNKAMDNRTYNEEMVVASNKTCKPIHINIQRISAPLSTDFKPDMLTTWIKFPQYRWLLPSSSYQHNELMLSDFLATKGCNLDECEANWLHKLLRKYKDKYLKEFYMYSNMPSSARDVNNYKDVLLFLAHNSFSNRYINGIISPYNRLMNVTFVQIFEDLVDPELTDAINLLDFVTGALNDKKMKHIVENCKINTTENKGINGLLDVIGRIIDSKNEHLYLINLILPHYNCLKNLLSDGTFKSDWIGNSYFHCFTKRQHLVGNVWIGKGKLYVNTPNIKMLFEIENQRVNSATVNVKNLSLTKYDLAYIDYVLTIGQLSGLKSHLIEVDTKDWNLLGFGINQQGEFGVCIRRFLVSTIPKVHLSKLPHTILSNLSVCTLSVLPRLTYKIKKETIDLEENFIIHTFDMPVENILESISKFLKNEENVVIAASMGREYKDYIDYVVGSVTRSELYLAFTDFFENYSISQTYSILYECRKYDLVNFSTLKVKNKYYPAQEGGLLNLLIEYKKINNDFLFNPDLVLTPELAYLKATQPESFMTNLITNIKERYNSLYTNIDKSLIIKRMRLLILNINSPNFEKEIIETLSTWGYTGVMGALGEIRVEKNYDTFKSVEYPASVTGMQNSFRLLKEFNDAFYETFVTTNMGSRLKNYDLEYNLDLENFIKLFKSFLFQQCLSCYGKLYVYNCNNITMGWLWFNNIFLACMQDEEFLSSFEERICKVVGWSNAPVERSSYENWVIMYQTLTNIVNSGLLQKTDLDKNKQFHRLGDDILNFKTIMQNYTSIDELHNVRKLSYMGTLSTFLVNFLKTPKTVTINNSNFRVTSRFCKLSSELVPYHQSYIFPNVLTEDFMDEDDYEEIKCELLSGDPDMDSVQEYLDGIENKFELEEITSCYVKSYGRFAKCTNAEICIVNLVGSSARPNDINKTRMVGNNLLIISEVVYPQFVNERGNLVGVYTKASDKRSLSIIDESQILFYLLTEQPKEIFAKAFGLKALDKNLLSREFFVQTYARYYVPGGSLFDKRVKLSAEEEIELLNTQSESLKKRRLLDEPKIVQEVEDVEVDLIKEYAEKEGLSEEIIKKYLKEQKSNKGLFDVDLIRHVIGLIKADETTEKHKVKIKSIIERPHDAKTIERIFEVPEVFQTGRSIVSDAKNKSLKEPRLRAELESLAPNLTNLILSNRLTINAAKAKKMKTNLTLWKSYLSQTSHNKKNKKFLIDLVTLIINDATASDDTKNNYIWDNIVDKISDKIVEDEDSESEDIAYESVPHAGFLNYKPR